MRFTKPDNVLVRYRHLRVIPGTAEDLLSLGEWKRAGYSGNDVSPRGGVTVAVLGVLDGEDFVSLTHATAYCSDSDNYCKSVGREIALGRALKKLATDPQMQITEEVH